MPGLPRARCGPKPFGTESDWPSLAPPAPPRAGSWRAGLGWDLELGPPRGRVWKGGLKGKSRCWSQEEQNGRWAGRQHRFPRGCRPPPPALLAEKSAVAPGLRAAITALPGSPRSPRASARTWEAGTLANFYSAETGERKRMVWAVGREAARRKGRPAGRRRPPSPRPQLPAPGRKRLLSRGSGWLPPRPGQGPIEGPRPRGAPLPLNGPLVEEQGPETHSSPLQLRPPGASGLHVPGDPRELRAQKGEGTPLSSLHPLISPPSSWGGSSSPQSPGSPAFLWLRHPLERGQGTHLPPKPGFLVTAQPHAHPTAHFLPPQGQGQAGR